MRSDLLPDAFVINWLVGHVIRDRSRKEVVNMDKFFEWLCGSVVSILD